MKRLTAMVCSFAVLVCVAAVSGPVAAPAGAGIVRATPSAKIAPAGHQRKVFQPSRKTKSVKVTPPSKWVRIGGHH